jgi:hypothetical protein
MLAEGSNQVSCFDVQILISQKEVKLPSETMKISNCSQTYFCTKFFIPLQKFTFDSDQMVPPHRLTL